MTNNKKPVRALGGANTGGAVDEHCSVKSLSGPDSACKENRRQERKSRWCALSPTATPPTRKRGQQSLSALGKPAHEITYKNEKGQSHNGRQSVGQT